MDPQLEPTKDDLRTEQEKITSRNRLILWGSMALLVAATIVGLVFLVKYSRGGYLPQLSNAAIEATDTAVKGDRASKVVLIEYSDFQCPACKKAKPFVDNVVKQYEGQIAFVYRNFPLKTLHPNAERAAWAAEAAALQNKYWEMHDKLFENQSTWAAETDPTDTFISYAKDLGMNAEQFKLDMAGDAVKKKVNTDLASASTAKLGGTPSFFINGQFVQVSSYGELGPAIAAAIAANK